MAADIDSEPVTEKVQSYLDKYKISSLFEVTYVMSVY